MGSLRWIFGSCFLVRAGHGVVHLQHFLMDDISGVAQIPKSAKEPRPWAPQCHCSSSSYFALVCGPILWGTSFNMKKSPDAMFYHVLSYFIMFYHVLHNTEDMVWVLRIWRAGCKRRFSSFATGHAEKSSSLNWRRLTKLAKTWAAAAKLEWSQMKCNHHLDTWVGTSQDCT